MSGLTTTYTSTGTINRIGISKHLTSTDRIAYTCPANTIAELSGGLVVDDKGSGTAIAIAVGRYDSSAPGNYLYYAIGTLVGLQQMSAIPTSVVLQPLDLITCVAQNGSNTGGGFIDLTIQQIQQPSALASMFQDNQQPVVEKKKEKKNVRNK